MIASLLEEQFVTSFYSLDEKNTRERNPSEDKDELSHDSWHVESDYSALMEIGIKLRAIISLSFDCIFFGRTA